MKRPLRNLLIGLAGVAGIFGGVWLFQATQDLLQVDPFRDYRKRDQISGEDAIGATLRDADLKFYSGERLVAEARIALAEVTRDRQITRLTGIQAGRYLPLKGTPVRFTAKAGEWNDFSRSFRATGTVQAVHKEFDLKSESLVFESRTDLLRIPRQVKGKLIGGKLETKDFQYHVATGDWQLGPVFWEGPIALQDVPANKQNQRWKIRALGGQRRGNKEVFRDAEATDGDVIIRAPVIERDVKTDVLVATGRVEYFSREANLVSDKATVFRKEKRAIVEGNVTMLVKAEEDQKLEISEVPPLRPIVPESIANSRPPAPDDKFRDIEKELRDPDSKRKYPTQVRAERIEYWYQRGQRRAIITGNPQARQNFPGDAWRQVWAERGDYDGEKETLRLTPAAGKRVLYKASNGDDLRFEWLLVSTKEGDDSYEHGAVEGEFGVDEEAEEGPAPP